VSDPGGGIFLGLHLRRIGRRLWALGMAMLALWLLDE
jgi:hypothetical protein